MWVVTKPFEFQVVDKDSGSRCGTAIFNKGDVVMSFRREVCTLDNSTILVIEFCNSAPRSFRGVDFNIEDYISANLEDHISVTHEQSMDRVSRDSETTKTVYLQIKLLSTEPDVNEFLMTFPRERVVDIKKTSRATNDSRFMVIYTKEE